jgi:hypothetical protein
MKLFPGRMYQGRREVSPDSKPDVWICRRESDFEPGQIPDAASISECTACSARIVFNPARKVSAPRICMQCADVTPGPFE